MERRPEQFQGGEQIAGTPYQVKGLIGSGGMGSVYEVEHLELGRVFVLKALHGHLSSRSDLVGRMRNEWRALAKLNHPHIVQVTDAGQTTTGLPFYVMERLEGRTLGQLLAESGRLSLRRASEIIIDVLRGLDAAHATGAIHRDIKPQNIFVQDVGGTKLLDFGIAKLRDRAARVVTAGGVSIGTPRYMAPEQAEGGNVDGRADIYAAALVLYECVLGRGPFAHIRDPNMLVMAHIGEEPERVDYLDASIPPELGDLIHRWLSKFPSSRPATAGLAEIELESLMSLFPGDSDEPDDVTLGGDYDASTVGAAQPALALAPSDRPPVLAGPSAIPGASPQGEEKSAVALTPTATVGSPEQVQKRVPSSTLGWGTQMEGTGQSPVPPKRSSKTPPPISSNPPQPRAAGIRESSPRRTLAVVAATSLGSFCLAWIIVGLLSSSGSRESRQESESNVASSAGPERAARASSRGQGTSGTAPGTQNRVLGPPGGQGLNSAKPELSPAIHENSSDSQLDAPAGRDTPTEVPVPEKGQTKAEGAVQPAAKAARDSAAGPAPAIQVHKVVPRVPPQPAESTSDGELPGSGLW